MESAEEMHSWFVALHLRTQLFESSSHHGDELHTYMYKWYQTRSPSPPSKGCDYIIHDNIDCSTKQKYMYMAHSLFDESPSGQPAPGRKSASRTLALLSDLPGLLPLPTHCG